MEYSSLPHTQLKLSKIALGTMTFGEQNTEKEAHQQLDYALDQGVNLIDTAEMYPVPPNAQTTGKTEEYIGSWLPKNRQKVVLATKVSGVFASSGPSGLEHIQRSSATEKNIHQALEGSLKRLHTEHIDIYQIHWPTRPVNNFGKLLFPNQQQAALAEQPSSALDQETEGILAEMRALDKLIKAGKISYYGLSNETPWGLMRYLGLAEKHNLPRPITIQNPYSLLNRSFEVGLAEVALHEKIGLLAYSPLAFGRLTGKYIGAAPPKARLTLFNRFQRYNHPRSLAASEAYVAVAKKFNLSPTKLALAYVHQKPFVTSTIIGATSLEQLEENIASLEHKLPLECLAELEAIHQEFPIPAP